MKNQETPYLKAEATARNTHAGPEDSYDLDGTGKIMTVVEHLDELRGRILKSLAAIVAAFLISLFWSKDIIRWLEAPAGNITFQALSLEEPLIVYFKVSFYTALVLAFPFILFQAVSFISPGLKKHERKVLIPLVISGPLLFICGVLFAYFLLLPPMLSFFGSFGQGMSPINQRLDFYISLVTSILVYMGLCFQLPIVLFALSFTNIVSSRKLLAVWRYAVFGAAIVAAILTPDPTAFSMLIVMLALIALYFLSVWLLRLCGR